MEDEYVYDRDCNDCGLRRVQKLLFSMTIKYFVRTVVPKDMAND